MSRTLLHITPGWGPQHPRWRAFGWPNMTPKYQAREHGRRHYGGHRFDSTGTLPTHVAERKIDELRLKEAMDTDGG